jgi:hypothetical protein
MSKIIQPGEENSCAERPAELLTEIPEKDKQYITPSYIETKLNSDRKMEARNIVRVINEYGVSDRQKLFIIYLLALELENRILLSGIASSVAAAEKEIDSPKVLVKTPVVEKPSTPTSTPSPSGLLITDKKILFG